MPAAASFSREHEAGVRARSPSRADAGSPGARVWRACAQASQLRNGKRSRSGTFMVSTSDGNARRTTLNSASSERFRSAERARSRPESRMQEPPLPRRNLLAGPPCLEVVRDRVDARASSCCACEPARTASRRSFLAALEGALERVERPIRPGRARHDRGGEVLLERARARWVRRPRRGGDRRPTCCASTGSSPACSPSRASRSRR